MRVIVLAAGFATRLYPLTRDRAKPLLPVAGRPVVSHLLDRVRALPDIRDVLLVTNARFHRDFQSWASADRGRPPVRVVANGSTSADDRQGALRDLLMAWQSADAELAAEDLLVVAGDNLVGFDLAPFFAHFRAIGRPMLMVRRVPGAVPPGRHGEVTIDERGQIVRFREKPMDPRSDLAALCLYLFPARTKTRLSTYLAHGVNPDAPGHFIAWLAEREPVHAHVLDGPYFDIGNRESLKAAHQHFVPVTAPE